MINNTAIKELNEAQNKIDNFSTNLLKTKSSSDEKNETCYFKEKEGSKQSDGVFIWTKDIQGFILR